MFRKMIVVLIGAATFAALTALMIPTEAAARGGWRGGHGWHGGYRGGYGWRGYYGGRGYGFRYYGLGWPYYGYPYYPAAYYGYYGCYRNVRVATPYGWTWQRVWVCG